MSPLSATISGGTDSRGGIVGYPSDRLYEEVAFIAYHFHWSQADLLNLDHLSRKRWINEINKINQNLSNASNL
jgi:hypothetical protein